MGIYFVLFTIFSIINITMDLFYFRECNINSKSNSFGKEQATFVSVVSIYFTSIYFYFMVFLILYIRISIFSFLICYFYY